MELAVNNGFIFNMYKLLSESNRYLIRQLLAYDCISLSQIQFSLTNLFRVLYHIPIECSSFSYILNSLVTSYLKSVVDKSLRSSVLKYYLLGSPANTELDLKRIIISRLCGCYLHKVMEFTHIANINRFTFNIPVEICSSKFENLKTVESTENYSKKETFPSASDFQSFLLPLEQDYTKSSKGLNFHATNLRHVVKQSAYNSLKDDDEYLPVNNLINNFEKSIPKEHNVNYINQINGFSEHSKASKSEIFDNCNISCLQDNCVQQNSNQRKYSTNKFNEVSFNYSLDVFADHVEQQDCDTEKDDSSKSNYVIFSESPANERCSMDELDNLDSDNSNMFSENSEGVNIKKFWDNKINLDDSSSDDDESDNWYNDSNESHSDSFEIFSQNFKNDFPSESSCFQNEMFTDNRPLTAHEYVNPCFEDNYIFESDHIASINKDWNNTMKDVSSEPRQAKRVSFVPLPELVSVYKFEPDNDGYCYSMYVLDQLRFRNRIQEFEAIIAPYLTSEHRAKVYRQYKL